MYAKNFESQNKTPEKPNKPKQTRSQSDNLNIYGGSFLVIALVFFITFQFVEPAPPRKLTIATGNADGAYYSYAQEFKTRLAEYGITLNVRTTSGSLDNVSLLRDKSEDVQLAFVQSGTSKPKPEPELMSLASLYYEPLWLFSRNPIPKGQLKELAGKTVSIGAMGSGTRTIANLLLEDNGLKGAINTVELAGSDAIHALSKGEIDALFTVVAANSNMIQTLLNSREFHLMSFNRAEAYEQRYRFLSRVRVPQGSISLEKDIPANEIQLLAPTAMLVANNTLHPALSDLIMQITSELFSSGNLFSSKGQFPSQKHLDFPLSPEAARFYESGPPLLQRYLPFWAATLVDRLKVLLLPLIALMIPLMRILPPTYRWSVRKRIYHWYEQLQLIDQSSTEIPTEANLELCLANLDKMESEVREVEVPLAYAHELYVLRQHVDLLARQISIREKRAEQMEAAGN